MSTSRTQRVIGVVVQLQKEERVTALLMFAYSFLAMTAYNIVKPVTRSKFIGELGADNLPYVLLAAGLFIGVVMQFYSRLVGLLPRRWVIPCTGCGMMALLIAFWGLFKTDQAWVSVGFYLFGLIIGILLISQFWTLANDIYDPRQAKRLFGFIGGGASLGGMTGAGLTALFAGTVGTENLLLGSTSVLAACMLVVAGILRREKIRAPSGVVLPREEGLSGKEAIRLLRESKHLQMIALVIGFAAVGAAVIEQQLNMAAEAFKGRDATDAITGFLAQVTLYVSVIGFVVQVGLTSRVHRLLGIGFALLVLPVGLGATALIMLVNAALWAPALARVLDSSLRYSLDKTTREVLFLPLPTELKYQAKPFVDVTVDRFAKGMAALLLLILIKGLGLTWQQLSYASLAMTALWVVTAVRARREYLEAFRRGLERREIEAATLRLPAADLSTIETLVQELAHPDERRVTYAIDLLEALDKRTLITPLLLHHDSPDVRARALRALEVAGAETSEHWLSVVRPMLADDSPEVRAAAVRALAAARDARAVDVMRPYLQDRDPRVVATAAVALAASERRADREDAAAVLTRLASDTRDRSARREAAAALGEIAGPDFRQLLAPLLCDSSPEVAEEALRSVQRLDTRDPLFLPVLVSLLRHRLLKRSAREVLVRYGDDALDSLARSLRDPNEQVWVRRHIPATLARIPSQKSMDTLIGALREQDGFLRFKVVAAIEKLRQEHPELIVDHQPVEELTLNEALRYSRYLNLYACLFDEHGPGRRSLLSRALEEKLQRTLDRIYRLLGLIYPWKDIVSARWAIEHGSARLRASAVEYLDNVLAGPLRKRLMPFVEDTPVQEKGMRAETLLTSPACTAEESLTRLLGDEDPVVAAATAHFIVETQRWALADHVRAVLARADVKDPLVQDAMTWALAASERRVHAGVGSGANLPIVEVVARLCRIPLFDFVSVDELFRIAGAGRLSSHAAGVVLHREGEAHDVLEFLLDGGVMLERVGSKVAEVNAPAALAFEDVVEPCPMRHTARTIGPVVCLALTRGEFFTVLSENPELTQGLFRMLLDNPVLSGWRAVLRSETAARLASLSAAALKPVDEVLLLEEIPIFARASVKQLLEVAKVTRRMPFSATGRVFGEGESPGICVLLSGRLSLCHPDGDATALAEPGGIFGLYDTLVGSPADCRGEVVEPGLALRIDREDLFDVLADHTDLLEGLFSVMCVRPLFQTHLTPQ